MSPKEQSLPIRNNYAESVYIKFEICKVYENIYIYIFKARIKFVRLSHLRLH